MVDPGTIQAAVLLLWKHGPGTMITKADVSNAYKNIAVDRRQRKYQVYRFGEALFMDLCLLVSSRLNPTRNPR